MSETTTLPLTEQLPETELADAALRIAFPSPSAGRGSAISSRLVSILHQGAQPRWILIGDTRSALPVLGSWQPFKWLSRLQWRLILLACRTRLLGRLPKVVQETRALDVSQWRRWLPELQDSWTTVIHIGHPSVTRKAILFFVDQASTVRAVVKVPLTEAAREAVINEADVLRHLQGRSAVPEMLFTDHEQGIAGQSWMDGDPIGRSLTQKHLELLLILAESRTTVCLRDQRAEIAAAVKNANLPIEAAMLDQAFALLDNPEPLPVCIEHRDFAPWNLKRLPNGHLTLIDWEWATMQGLPWQDVCHFFYIQDSHFHGPGKVWEQMTQHPVCQNYVQKLGLSRNAVAGLTAYYLLHTLCLDRDSGTADSIAYATKQLRALIAQASSVTS